MYTKKDYELKKIYLLLTTIAWYLKKAFTYYKILKVLFCLQENTQALKSNQC